MSFRVVIRGHGAGHGAGTRRRCGGGEPDAESPASSRSAQLEPVAWFQVVRTALQATATVYLGDLSAARTLLGQARRALEQCERSEFLVGVVERAERVLIAATAGPRIVSTPLTAAELRVLRHLPTQLSIPEIAAGLFVSRFTIKTQALAVYHKLGVSSRTAAVHRARELGLLPEMPVREA